MNADLGKMLIFFGAILILAGTLFLLANKIPGVGRLPGDILVQKKNLTFFFPITTSILISIILSLIFYFFNRR